MKNSNCKPRFFTILFLCLISNSFAQVDSTFDDPGDIAFVAWSRSTQDGYAFVLLDECPPNTVIKFIDEEWTGSGFYSPTGEGENTWTNSTSAYIPRGTIIIVQNADNNPTCNLGSVSESDAGFAIASIDQIFAISGTRSNPTFLAMIGHSTLPNNGSGARQTLSGTGLTTGINSIHRTDESLYNGSTKCDSSISDCTSSINSDSNWVALSSSVTFPNNVTANFNGKALPVQLISFSANEYSNEAVTLRWQTASEINNLGFTIKHYNEQLDEWKTIGFVSGVGNSFNINTYQYEHFIKSPLLTSNIYKLIQTDFDGTTTEIGTAIHDINKNSKHISIFEDLSSRYIYINSEDRIKITAMTISGKIIMPTAAENERVTIDKSNWESGLYLIKIDSENLVQYHKTIVD